MIDRALVRRMAELAYLSFSDAEADVLAAELESILGHVAQLEGLDTTGIEPAELEGARLPLRPDVLAPGLDHADALAAAPRVEGDGFAVPAFVEEK